MIRLVLVRHCESVGNIAFHKSFFQQDDSMYTDKFRNTPSIGWALSEYGKKHAIEVGVYLKGKVVFDQIFVSDVKRAMETFKLMDIVSGEIAYTELLRERDYAGLELMPKIDWLRCVSDLDEAFQSLTWRPPCGESMEDVIHRVENFLANHAVESKAILIVTHGDVIQAMRIALLGLIGDSRKVFREIRGNYIRTGQVFCYSKSGNGSYVENSFHFDGSEWHDLSLDMDMDQ